jgi:hypothetical protein
MDLCDDDSALHQSPCSIYPVQRVWPLSSATRHRHPVVSTNPSDLSQHETEWSMTSVTVQFSHEHAASSENQQEDLLSALAAEARQLWESSSLAVESPPQFLRDSTSTAHFASPALLMPEFAGSFGAQTCVDFSGQSTPMTPFSDHHASCQNGPALKPQLSTSHAAAAAAAVQRRRSINDAINSAAAAAAAAFYENSNMSADAELEEFSLGPGCPRGQP